MVVVIAIWEETSDGGVGLIFCVSVVGLLALCLCGLGLLCSVCLRVLSMSCGCE